VDGNEYIDLNAGLAVCNVGHSHPRVVQAIKDQADRFIHYSYTDFYYENYIDLGETLQELIPGDFKKKFFYGNRGAESVEAARAALVNCGVSVIRWMPPLLITEELIDSALEIFDGVLTEVEKKG